MFVNLLPFHIFAPDFHNRRILVDAPSATTASRKPAGASSLSIFPNSSLAYRHVYFYFSRMVCRHCRFQFCWVCLKNWDVHGYNNTVCNSYEEPPRTSTMNDAKANLERWMFYYDRFINHEVSTKLEEELVKRSKEKMLHIQNNSTLSWIEVCLFYFQNHVCTDMSYPQTHFMQNAVEELSKCRRALKWSYAMGYYLASGNKKHMFEDIQSCVSSSYYALCL